MFNYTDVNQTQLLSRRKFLFTGALAVGTSTLSLQAMASMMEGNDVSGQRYIVDLLKQSLSQAKNIEHADIEKFAADYIAVHKLKTKCTGAEKFIDSCKLTTLFMHNTDYIRLHELNNVVEQRSSEGKWRSAKIKYLGLLHKEIVT